MTDNEIDIGDGMMLTATDREIELRNKLADEIAELARAYVRAGLRPLIVCAMINMFALDAKRAWSLHREGHSNGNGAMHDD
jgi:hypothetical protein